MKNKMNMLEVKVNDKPETQFERSHPILVCVRSDGSHTGLTFPEARTLLNNLNTALNSMLQKVLDEKTTA